MKDLRDNDTCFAFQGNMTGGCNGYVHVADWIWKNMVQNMYITTIEYAIYILNRNGILYIPRELSSKCCTTFLEENNAFVENDPIKEEKEKTVERKEDNTDISEKMIHIEIERPLNTKGIEEEENCAGNVTQEESNSEETLQPMQQPAKKALLPLDVQITEPSTSRNTHTGVRKKFQKETPREKKLQKRIGRLKAKVKALHERYRRLKKQFEKMKKNEAAGKKLDEFGTLRRVAK